VSCFVVLADITKKGFDASMRELEKKLQKYS